MTVHSLSQAHPVRLVLLGIFYLRLLISASSVIVMAEQMGVLTPMENALLVQDINFTVICMIIASIYNL